jgi:hypothetical protein
LYFFIIGAVLPIPVYLLSHRYPNSLWKGVHIPLFLGGLNYLPPATGMNYGSWAIVGLNFGWLIRKRVHGWWSKYNFVLSSALGLVSRNRRCGHILDCLLHWRQRPVQLVGNTGIPSTSIYTPSSSVAFC